jgi:hypothetical protein
MLTHFIEYTTAFYKKQAELEQQELNKIELNRIANAAVASQVPPFLTTECLPLQNVVDIDIQMLYKHFVSATNESCAHHKTDCLDIFVRIDRDLMFYICN